MATISFETTTASKLRNGIFRALMLNLAAAATPFIFLRSLYFLVEHEYGSEFIIQPVVGDFALIAIGTFFANLITLASLEKVKGWQGPSFRTQIMLIVAGVLTIPCWSFYVAGVHGTNGFFKVVKFDNIRLWYFVTIFATIGLSCTFLMLFSHDRVRDQVRAKFSKVP